MSSESSDPSIDSGDALGEALRVYIEHRAAGSGESDSELLRRHPELCDLLKPLLEQDDASSGDVRPGAVIGDYRLVEAIGRGGMGEVWEAEQISLKRRVALKLLRDHVFASTHSIERFRREALAGARLRHPCIVAVHAVGESNGIHFIAQELIESRRTLSNLVREARELPAIPPNWWRDIAQLFARLADALEVAHENGIIHRDIKPSNVLITKDGTPKIVDFGLAMVAGESELSRTGDLSGSPFYMSPEQAAAKRVGIDERSDVFSLGASMFEALTLQRPFEGDTVAQVLTKILFHDPRDPREIRSLCPRDLAVISMKMLEKAPTQRYPSMRAVADELERSLRNEPIRARPPGVIGRGVKWSRRHPVLAASSAIVCVSLGVVSGLLFETLRARNAAQESALAARESAAAEARAAREAEQSAIAEARAARAAEASAADARLEAKTSSRVVDFLVDAFVESSPQRAMGREVSAREVLDRGVKNIRAGLSEPHEAGLRARLLDSLGLVYSRLGLSEQAEQLLLEARALATGAFGSDAERTLAIRSELGNHYSQNGRHAEAAAELAAALELCVARGGSESVQALQLEGNLGGVLLRLGATDRAEEHLRHSIASLQAQGQWCANSMLTLAQLLDGIRRPEEAGELLQEAMDQFSARNGPDHPDTLDVLDAMARHEIRAGRFDEAAELARQIAISRECIFGPKHSNTLESQARTAYYASKRQPVASLDAIGNLRATSLLEFGPDHPTTLLLSNFLVHLLMMQGRFEEAESVSVELMDHLARHPEISANDRTARMYFLGQLEWSRGHHEIGLGVLEEIIELARGNEGSHGLEIDAVAGSACLMYERLERLEDALQLARYRLSTLEPDHPERAKVEADILRLEELVEGR